MYNSFLAPEKRIGFFLNKSSFSLFNTASLDLFDQAVCWALGTCSSGGNRLAKAKTSLNWKVYPNPVKGSLLIELEKVELGSSMHIKLMSMQGQSLMDKEMSLISKKARLSLEHLNLQQGIYLLELAYQGERQVFRLSVEN
ncbi:MAG: T9SS type A sorting domain-containing protein [Bacteroidota bacterium]